MTLACTFLNEAEFKERDDARVAAINEHKAAHPDVAYPDYWTDELRDKLCLIMPAGLMWEARWLFDPSDPTDIANGRDWLVHAQQPGYNGYLSVHYLRDWADKRPPLNVICPDYSDWTVDAKSSNGDGWTVTGTAPLITCSPSIVVKGYHGFLQNGVFTDPI